MMTSDPPLRPAHTENAEYSSPSSSRHHGEPHPGHHGPRRALRAAFFALAALWGFLAGAVAVALGVLMSGARVEWSGSAVVTVAAGAAVAACGGWLSSKAYSDLRHRR